MNKRQVQRDLVTQRLWMEIEPLLPQWRPSPRGGRPRRDDRTALNGILYVLLTGTPWEHLPQELGYGCGMTCWRRLREWQAAGVWDELHRVMLERLRQHDQIDWHRASVDSAAVATLRGARRQGRTRPTEASSAANAM